MRAQALSLLAEKMKINMKLLVPRRRASRLQTDTENHICKILAHYKMKITVEAGERIVDILNVKFKFNDSVFKLSEIFLAENTISRAHAKQQCKHITIL